MISLDFCPESRPAGANGLLSKIVVMFSINGEMIVQLPLDAVRIAMPLLVFLS
jgi:ACR3 family arsenite transporter